MINLKFKTYFEPFQTRFKSTSAAQDSNDDKASLFSIGLSLMLVRLCVFLGTYRIRKCFSSGFKRIARRKLLHPVNNSQHNILARLRPLMTFTFGSTTLMFSNRAFVKRMNAV